MYNVERGGGGRGKGDRMEKKFFMLVGRIIEKKEVANS